MSRQARHDRRAYEQEWAHRRHASNLFDPITDPTSSAYLLQKQASYQANLQRGIVHDAVPYLHAYRVAFEGLKIPLICTLGAQTSLLPIGAKALNTLLPGTAVWVAITPQLAYGVIVMVEGYPAADPALALSDWTHATSRCGLHVDLGYEAVFRTAGGGGLQNWACGRPADSLPIGEYGAITETGLRLQLDPFLAQLSADEAAGLFVFYHDQFVRLAGHNLELFSAGHVERFLDDAGEISLYRGWTPYPWEQLGALSRATDPTRALTADQVQNATPYYASLEPAEDDQLPMHRRVFLGGYLGQGGKDLVVAPPPSPPSVLTRSGSTAADAVPAGLLEEQRTLAGAYLLRAAQGVHLLKQGAIPAPLPRRRPEDADGDGPENYRAAGATGNGPPHRVAANLATNADHPGLQRVAGLMDEIAMRRNWEGEHALHYHGKDWSLAEEENSPLAAGYTPPLDQLASNHVLPPPDPVKLKVDDRYGEVSFYPTEAGQHFLEDGSVVIRDAFGSRIVMSHGNIELQPAADLIARPGRSVITWAGRDVVLKARGCIDFSAATGSVRGKAEKDLMLLAGNGGTGGLLLESRGMDTLDYENKLGTDATGGGIQLKATIGSVLAWGQNVYLRSLDAGTIFLDADAGNGTLFSLSQTIDRYCTAGAADHFGPPGKVTASNVFGPYENQLGAALSVNGALTVATGAVVRGSVNVVQGHIFTDEARSFGGQVGDYGTDGSAASSFKDQVQAEVKAVQAAAKDGSAAYTSGLSPIWYTSGGAGDAETISAVGFSYRTTPQYGAADYTLWETSWQQLLRETGASTDLWVEPPVRAAGQATYPYPGADRLISGDAYHEQPLSLFDLSKGVARSRSENQSAYEQPRYAAVAMKPIDGNYPVIDITKPKGTSSA